MSPSIGQQLSGSPYFFHRVLGEAFGDGGIVDSERLWGPRSLGHMVQHTVVGVDGVTVPIGAPPDGAQEPPVAVSPVAIAALSPAPEQAAGADSIITPPLQFASPKVETAAAH